MRWPPAWARARSAYRDIQSGQPVAIVALLRAGSGGSERHHQPGGATARAGGGHRAGRAGVARGVPAARGAARRLLTDCNVWAICYSMPATAHKAICKNPRCPRNGKPFARPRRRDAQYCSSRCRVAAHRARQAPDPVVAWFDGKRRRARAEDELATHLLEIAARDDDGAPKTGRRYYYLALSHGYIAVDMSDTPEGKRSRDRAYKAVTKKLGQLRMAGKLDWDMVLDLTRELVEWQVYDSPRAARAALRRRYDEDRWPGQTYYPILIVEKDTLEPVCLPFAERWQMPFASSRGYSSLKLQHDVAKLLIRPPRWPPATRTPAERIVYFVSDLDPSGLDLQRAWADALENFNVPHRIVRVGLTPEQVADPELDLDRLAIEVKPSDSRAKAFVAEYGERCWEADVLPGAVIEQAIDDHIAIWLDQRAWNQRVDEIERARQLL